jgi:hypothetical protein
MKRVLVRQNAPSGESHCNSSLPTVISKKRQFEEFEDYQANSATGLLAPIARNGDSNLNFRLPQILTLLEQVRRPSGASSGRCGPPLSLLPALNIVGARFQPYSFPVGMRTGRVGQPSPFQKGRAFLDSLECPLCRSQKDDVLGRADDAAQVMSGKGYRNEN